eukprot:g2872.t1
MNVSTDRVDPSGSDSDSADSDQLVFEDEFSVQTSQSRAPQQEPQQTTPAPTQSSTAASAHAHATTNEAPLASESGQHNRQLEQDARDHIDAAFAAAERDKERERCAALERERDEAIRVARFAQTAELKANKRAEEAHRAAEESQRACDQAVAGRVKAEAHLGRAREEATRREEEAERVQHKLVAEERKAAKAASEAAHAEISALKRDLAAAQAARDDAERERDAVLEVEQTAKEEVSLLRARLAESDYEELLKLRAERNALRQRATSLAKELCACHRRLDGGGTSTDRSSADARGDRNVCGNDNDRAAAGDYCRLEQLHEQLQHARAQAASSSQEAAAFRAALEHALANARQSRDRQEVDGANEVERAHRLIPDQGQGSGGRGHDPAAKAQQSKARASLSRRLGSRIGKVAGVSR